jgi:hypothetical protein
MELQQLKEFLTPSNLLWLSVGLQLAGALACWFVAEAVVTRVGAMRVTPWPVLRERAAPQRRIEAALVLPLRGQVLLHDGFVASAMIERDAA